jgi:hypothetical protein
VKSKKEIVLDQEKCLILLGTSSPLTSKHASPCQLLVRYVACTGPLNHDVFALCQGFEIRDMSDPVVGIDHSAVHPRPDSFPL